MQTPGFQVTAGADGMTHDVSFTSHISTSPGDWAVTMQGVSSQVQAIVHFRILPTLPNTAPPNTAQCSAAGSVDGQADPPVAKLGSTIEITAWNFRQGEKTRAWFTTPAGVPVAAQGVPGIYIHPGGVLGPYPIDTGAGVFSNTPGRWALTVHGTVSGHELVIYFCLFQ